MGGIQNDWLTVLSPEFAKPYYKELYDFVVKEYQSGTVFPPKKDISTHSHIHRWLRSKA